ncbi:MAG: RsmE family RNA methyltransferase [Chloroflexota bacterium]
MTHRFFIPPDWLTPPTVTLQGDTARQIKTVLRLKPDDLIVVLDNSGQAWQVKLTDVGKSQITGEIIAQQATSSEPAIQLTLYQGTLKAQKFEWVLQKGTELGISRFVPTICQRSIVTKIETKKYIRWQRIIQEAAEQSQRGKLPELTPTLPFPEAVQQAQSADIALIPWEEAPAAASLKQHLTALQGQSLAMFIGPEGGFTPAEVDQAQNAGLNTITLGPRILRAETAGLALSTAILYELGEW